MPTLYPAPRAVLSSALAALLLGALLLAACAAPDGQSAPDSAPAGLAGTSWVLSELNGAAPVAEATLQFDAEGRLAGSTGCNSYSGGYSVEGASLAVGQLVSTKMACMADGVMAQEADFLAALGQAASYSIAGDTLTIEAADGASLRFTRV